MRRSPGWIAVFVSLVSILVGLPSQAECPDSHAQLMPLFEAQIHVLAAPLAPLACSSSMKSEISEDELLKIYALWEKNPLFRSVQPGGLCERRAYLINKELAERGIGSERIYMEAPAIVATVSDSDGNLKEAYQYGFHVVPTVRVKMGSGEIRTMVLDTQFFSRPMPIDEYFAAVTGQSCIEVEKEPSRIGYRCHYTRKPANYRSEPEMAIAAVADSCGWSLSQEYENQIREFNRRRAHSPATPLEFSVDPALGPQRSALAWGLEKLRIKLAKSVKAGTDRMNRIHAGKEEASHEKVSQLREQIRQTSEDLERFPAERKRILHGL